MAISIVIGGYVLLVAAHPRPTTLRDWLTLVGHVLVLTGYLTLTTH